MNELVSLCPRLPLANLTNLNLSRTHRLVDERGAGAWPVMAGANARTHALKVSFCVCVCACVFVCRIFCIVYHALCIVCADNLAIAFDDGAEHCAAQVLAQLPNLLQLNLTSCRMTGARFVVLADAIGQMSQLQHLTLSGTPSA